MVQAGVDNLLDIKRLSAHKIKDILNIAPSSIGTSSPAREFELREIIENSQHYNRLIKTAEQQIDELMADIKSVITTVTGIGNRLGAVILAEMRNSHTFDNPAQLQAFADLELAIYQSGQMEMTGKTVKRGPPHLRWALLQAAKACTRYSPSFRQYLKLKLAQGKYYNVAITHVAKKLIRVIFYLLKNNCPFDENKLS